MSKHTPGPWSRSWVYGALRHVCRNVDPDAFWFPDEGEDEETANYPDYQTPGDIDLITAAPELLEACEALIAADHPDHFAARMSDSEMAAIEAIKSAIARATS